MQNSLPSTQPTVVTTGTANVSATGSAGTYTTDVAVPAVGVITGITGTVVSNAYSNAFGAITLPLPYTEVTTSGTVQLNVTAYFAYTSLKGGSRVLRLVVQLPTGSPYLSSANWTFSYTFNQVMQS